MIIANNSTETLPGKISYITKSTSKMEYCMITEDYFVTKALKINLEAKAQEPKEWVDLYKTVSQEIDKREKSNKYLQGTRC